MNPSADPYTAQSNRRRNVVLGALVAAALLLGFSLGRGGQLAAIGIGPHGGTIRSVASDGVPPVLPRVEDAPPPVLLDPQAQGPRMPDEVRQWLMHLERIERQRIQMASRQIGEIAVSMAMIQGAGATQQVLDGLLGGDADAIDGGAPTEKLAQDTQSQQDAWQKLIADYEALPPPPECVPLANSYRQTLTQTSVMMTEVLRALARSQEDPQSALAALYAMQGQSASRIDAAAGQSNSELGAVCAKYNERPWFTIQTDAKGGMMGHVQLPDFGRGGGGDAGGAPPTGPRSLDIGP